MTKLEDLARQATATPVAPPPTLEVLRTRARRRTRRLVASTVGVVVIGGAAIGLVVASTSSDSSSRSIVAHPVPSTVASGRSTARPVLDDCRAMNASESVVEGSSFAAGGAKPIPAEVFADPIRGVSGPLATLVQSRGAVQPSGDGNAAGKVTNAQVNGRDAYATLDLNTHSQLVMWDLSSGGTAQLHAQGLTEDETRALAEQIDAGTTALPQNLESIGTTDTASVGMSTCAANGDNVRITEIRGSQPSRYSEAMFDSTSDARRFDRDGATIVIEAFGDGFDTANATYHEATPEEWQALLR